MKRIDYSEILDVFLWGMAFLMQPTLRNVLQGYEGLDYPSRSDRVLERMQEKRLLSRSGRGSRAAFSITAEGLKQATTISPHLHWDAPWDGHWRVVIFDLPAPSDRVRQALWKALRAKKLGLLQRSVWIWPHEIEPMLQEFTDARGLPECFCGMEVRRLFLCTDVEVVQSAWNFKAIAEMHQAYLRQTPSFLTRVAKAKNLADLGRAAREERETYQEAFAQDPCLPRGLCLPTYLGFSVEKSHQEFRQRLRQKFSQQIQTTAKTNSP